MTRDPYYADRTVTVHHGDCLDVLRELPDQSVDAVVTDPPYGLEFMGKEWDGADGFRRSLNSADVDRPNVFGRTSRTSPEYRTLHTFQSWCQSWAAECLRVLKPGGHLLAFGGTRTYHRLTCAIEDAGFEIRDSIAWLYGSGFPKSLDVSKAIDRTRNDRPDVLALTTRLADLAATAGISRADVDAHMGTSDMGGWWLSRLAHRTACPSVENWTRLRDLIPGAHELDDEVWRLNGRKGTPGEAWDLRPITQEARAELRPGSTITFDQRSSSDRERRDIPATDDARTWQGWGTALKPAFEPVVVARKPLAGTVAANVLAHGTGALNIDATRIEGAVPEVPQGQFEGSNNNRKVAGRNGEMSAAHPAGRWPANVVLDESQAAALDQMSGEAKSAGLYQKGARGIGPKDGPASIPIDGLTSATYDDLGGASRFFYTAKASSSERIRLPDGMAHATVKPLSLMRWLVKLVTPPGGLVLDPFAGSGTTVEACILEGFRCTAIEREADYLPLIVQRVNRQRDPIAYTAAAGEDLGLFGLLDDPT